MAPPKVSDGIVNYGNYRPGAPGRKLRSRLMLIVIGVFLLGLVGLVPVIIYKWWSVNLSSSATHRVQFGSASQEDHTSAGVVCVQPASAASAQTTRGGMTVSPPAELSQQQAEAYPPDGFMQKQVDVYLRSVSGEFTQPTWIDISERGRIISATRDVEWEFIVGKGYEGVVQISVPQWSVAVLRPGSVASIDWSPPLVVVAGTWGDAESAIVFTAVDDAADLSLCLHAVDAETKEDVDGVSIACVPLLPLDARVAVIHGTDTDSGAAVFQRIGGNRFLWSVGGQGFASKFGFSEDLLVMGGGEYCGTVHLSQGWSGCFMVRATDVDGIGEIQVDWSIDIDGQKYYPKNGVVIVEMSRAPGSIRLWPGCGGSVPIAVIDVESNGGFWVHHCY